MNRTILNIEKKFNIHYIYYSIRELYDNKCCNIPENSGVYVVDVPEGFCANFTPASTAHSIIKAKNMLFSSEELQEKYLKSDRKRLYIGETIGQGGLKERLLCYVKHGRQERKNHCGGRAIWQIANNNDLLIGYYICKNPEILKKEMILEYKNKYDVYPVANWKY